MSSYQWNPMANSHVIPAQASDDFALGVRSDREAYLRAADEAAQSTA